MNFTKFLKDKYVVICLYVFNLILVALILNAFKVSIYAIVLTIVILCFNGIGILFFNYYRKNKFYIPFLQNLNKLHKKYLILETIPEPVTYEEKIIVEALYDINKSMLENIVMSINLILNEGDW